MNCNYTEQAEDDAQNGPVTANTIACWRITYALHLSPQELHHFWADRGGAPAGAALALKAALRHIDSMDGRNAGQR